MLLNHFQVPLAQYDNEDFNLVSSFQIFDIPSVKRPGRRFDKRVLLRNNGSSRNFSAVILTGLNTFANGTPPMYFHLLPIGTTACWCNNKVVYINWLADGGSQTNCVIIVLTAHAMVSVAHMIDNIRRFRCNTLEVSVNVSCSPPNSFLQ